MKKCFALFLSLALLLSCVPAAFAEEIGVVPYEIAALDTVIYIPENMTVTDETETDENVSVTLALNGREDCGFGINIGYSEAYEGYTMLTNARAVMDKGPELDFFKFAFRAFRTINYGGDGRLQLVD